MKLPFESNAPSSVPSLPFTIISSEKIIFINFFMQCVLIMFLLLPSPLGSYPPPYPSHYVISHTCRLSNVGAGQKYHGVFFFCVGWLLLGMGPALLCGWYTEWHSTGELIWDRLLLCTSDWTWTHYVNHACAELTALLPYTPAGSYNTWGTFLVICMGKLYIWQDFRGNTFVNKVYGNKIEIESELCIL